MKNIIFGILIIFFALISCKSDDDSLQKIDQIFDLYMKNSAGQDLLNSKKTGSFISYSVNDVFGDKDISPVVTTLKMTPDSLFYIEYLAGAKRVLDSTYSPDAAERIYHSKMTLSLVKKVNNVNDTITDVLQIDYRFTPTVFEVSKVYYNNQLKFTKQPNIPNVVTIIK